MHAESTAFSITTNGDGEMRRREKEGPLENPTSFTLRSATHFVGYSNKVLVHEKRRQHNRSLREQFFEVPLVGRGTLVTGDKLTLSQSRSNQNLGRC